MNTTGIRRLGRALRTITNWVLTVCTVLFFAALATIIILGHTVWNTDGKPTATTTTEPSAPATPQILAPGTPIQWQPAGQTCADGWTSHSIGKRGACSHHGGVVTVYESTPGNLTTRCHSAGHPKTLERARQLAGTTRNVPCDFPDNE
ncbi:DUF3761 domain-containing protein [Streptomyces sp. or20]|uniref:DUF3761 domain-containing protein n=1 Tax=Streptomyces sp. or20 TaxID=1828016 RepID=UPI000BF19EF0|nr:DUF3761 domain-containing protein [Streptomyces sp. or20]